MQQQNNIQKTYYCNKHISRKATHFSVDRNSLCCKDCVKLSGEVKPLENYLEYVDSLNSLINLDWTKEYNQLSQHLEEIVKNGSALVQQCIPKFQCINQVISDSTSKNGICTEYNIMRNWPEIQNFYTAFLELGDFMSKLVQMSSELLKDFSAAHSNLIDKRLTNTQQNACPITSPTEDLEDALTIKFGPGLSMDQINLQLQEKGQIIELLIDGSNCRQMQEKYSSVIVQALDKMTTLRSITLDISSSEVMDSEITQIFEAFEKLGELRTLILDFRNCKQLTIKTLNALRNLIITEIPLSKLELYFGGSPGLDDKVIFDLTNSISKLAHIKHLTLHVDGFGRIFEFVWNSAFPALEFLDLNFYGSLLDAINWQMIERAIEKLESLKELSVALDGSKKIKKLDLKLDHFFQKLLHLRKLEIWAQNIIMLTLSSKTCNHSQISPNLEYITLNLMKSPLVPQQLKYISDKIGRAHV